MKSNRREDLAGAGFMLLAMAGYGLNDLAIKLAGAGPVLAQRSALAVLLLLALSLAARNSLRAALSTPWVWGRSLGDAAATACYVYGLTGLPLGEAAALYQLTPIAFLLACATLQREPISPSGWLGVIVGFVGVILAIRPDPQALQDPHALAILGAVAFSVLRDLLMRGRPPTSPLLLATLSAGLTLLIGLAEVANPADLWPSSPSQGGLIVAAAAAISVGYVFLARATSIGNSGFVAPFRYAVLVYATLFGALFLGEWPDTLALIGIALILCGGLIATQRARPGRASI